MNCTKGVRKPRIIVVPRSHPYLTNLFTSLFIVSCEFVIIFCEFDSSDTQGGDQNCLLARDKCEAIVNKIMSIAGDINVSNHNSTKKFILIHYLYIITMFIEFNK